MLDMLGTHGSVDVGQVMAELHVSAATARRDLDTLAEQQLLTRTRGGAVGADTVAYDLPLRYAASGRIGAKRTIAARASAMVPVNSSVGLCGGTTSTEVARALAARADIAAPSPTPNLTVVTNAINIAAQLAVRPQIKVVVTGGVVQPRSYELVGPYSDLVLGRLTIDYAFVGVDGIDPHLGASVHNEEEAAVNSLMASRARHAVAIADSSKIGVRAFAAVDAAFGTVITDSSISPSAREEFESVGIGVVVAD
nr:DeoR/GlpR family DNA-binding transcription regulator [Spelaeicoccus albus]